MLLMYLMIYGIVMAFVTCAAGMEWVEHATHVLEAELLLLKARKISFIDPYLYTRHLPYPLSSEALFRMIASSMSYPE